MGVPVECGSRRWRSPVAYVLAGTLTAVDREARVIAVGATRLQLVEGLAVPGPLGSSVTVTVEERGAVLWATSVVMPPSAIFDAVKKPPSPAGRERPPDPSAEQRQAGS